MKKFERIIERAGHLFMALMVFAVIALGAQGCRGDGDEPEVPKEVFRIYNEKDSAAFCEVLKTAYGEDLDQVCATYGIRLDSVPSWPREMVIWRAIDNNHQKRITDLKLLYRNNGIPYHQSMREKTDINNISPAVWDMDSLRFLYLIGNRIQGAVPPPPEGCGKSLQDVYLADTGITSLPPEVFTLPSMECFDVYNAYRLESLPDGFNQIPAPDNQGSKIRYWIRKSALSGAPPVECPLNIALYDNNYTDMDWEALKRIDVASRLMEGERGSFFTGIRIYYNPFSGTIPPEIMADTLRLIYLHDITYPELQGYGFSNMPGRDELVRRRDEYCASHPEIAPLLSQLEIHPWPPHSSGE